MITYRELDKELIFNQGLECSLSSGETITIGRSEIFAETPAGSYRCDYLGNLSFENKKTCLQTLFSTLKKYNKQILSFEELY